jgi:hypothetical protein
MGLVLDERARKRLAEGRRLLGVIVSEHGRLRQAMRCLQLGPCHRYPPTPVPGNKIPNACIRVLGRSGSEASLRALARIGHATTDRRILQGLDMALAEASARSMPAATMPAS